MSLTAVAEALVVKARFAELDADVATVWNCILSEDGAKLQRRIAEFKIPKNGVIELLEAATKRRNPIKRALSVLIRNRLSHGGIIAPGAGLLREGEAGRGLLSRWYPETLSRRIEAIRLLRGRLLFSHQDGFELLAEYKHWKSAVAFVDPPYVVKGRRLYQHWSVDHTKLFKLMSEFRGEFLMTYDDAPEIRKLSRDFGFQTCKVAMKTTKHSVKMELLIGRNLEWSSKQ